MTARTISFITLGSTDVPRLRAFYATWGWPERPGASETFAAFDAGPGLRLALYRVDLLREEAAPGTEAGAGDRWSGVTLAINLDSADDVDEEVATALRAGGGLVATPVRRDWGGYSGYVADPDGNRWEIAWAPDE